VSRCLDDLSRENEISEVGRWCLLVDSDYGALHMSGSNTFPLIEKEHRCSDIIWLTSSFSKENWFS
jgi:hypothetical protein